MFHVLNRVNFDVKCFQTQLWNINTLFGHISEVSRLLSTQMRHLVCDVFSSEMSR